MEFLKTSYDTGLQIFGLKLAIPFLDYVREERVRKIFCSAIHMKRFVTASNLIGLINC